MQKKVLLILKGQKRISAYLFAFAMLLSMNPWFVYFDITVTRKLFLIAGLTVLSYLLSDDLFGYINRTGSILVLFLLAAFTGTRGNFNAYLGTFIHSLPFLLLLSAKDFFKSALFDVFNKVFWWIIAISLSFWILVLIGIPLPHVYWRGDSYAFENYYFFLKSVNYDFGLFPRFCSIFLEPGYVACFISFFLFIKKYDFRDWHNIVYLVALILTFSVAGWLLFAVGLIPYLNQRGRVKWAYIVFVFIAIAAYFYFIRNEDSAVGMLIGERVRFEDGSMVGYNRANMELEDYWNNSFWNSDKVMWGLGEQYKTNFDFGASVDLRAYIIRYGIIATILYVLFLLSCLIRYRSRLGVWFFIIVLAFVYRGYSIMFWEATLCLYLIGLTSLYVDTQHDVKRPKTTSLSNRGVHLRSRS